MTKQLFAFIFNFTLLSNIEHKIFEYECQKSDMDRQGSSNYIQQLQGLPNATTTLSQ